MDQHRQLCQFNSDLHQINETLDDLSRQLAGVKGQYGESIASANATSVAFVYFEKTIEVNHELLFAIICNLFYKVIGNFNSFFIFFFLSLIVSKIMSLFTASCKKKLF